MRRSDSPPGSGAPVAALEGGGRPVEETWDLGSIYPDFEAFRADREGFEAGLAEIERWRGRLDEGAAILRQALDAVFERRRALSRLHAWSHMRSDEDTRIAGHQRLRQEIELLATEFARSASWLRPEILALPPGRIESFLQEDRGLLPYAQFLRELVRLRPHVLAPDEERIVAEAGLLAGGPPHLFGVLHNAEMPRPEIEPPGEGPVALTPAEFSRLRVSPDRGFRERVFHAYFGAYDPFRETFGANLFDAIKAHVFHARVRRYDSCLDAALSSDNLPQSVYRNLVARAREHLPLLHRYLRLRARALGLDRCAYHDLHCPIVPSSSRRWSIDQASETILRATAPLGSAYGEALDSALSGRWIDWHPAPGKRAGAYASGAAYDAHPYVLLNFHGDYDAVSTLAHELGHAMHSWFSNRTQPFPTADYSIFVAEVASTFNEALLQEDLFRRAVTRDEKVFLLANWLDGIRATLFRQTFFAEFELEIHERAERGEALTGEALSARYLELLRTYQGHEEGVTDVEDRYAIEWACVPHFYYDFYVFQYATGIVAATSLADDVLAGRDGAAERYLEFLSSGGSDDPLELLRRAGVDLESPDPYAATFRAMEERLDALESLL